MVWDDLKPSDILTPQSFENAITTDMAIGGSTNTIIHLVAMAGRAGIKLELTKFDEIALRTPMIANIRPSGQQYLMEDFYYAGGLRALLAQIRDLLHLDCSTVNGKTLGENITPAKSKVLTLTSSSRRKTGSTFRTLWRSPSPPPT